MQHFFLLFLTLTVLVSYYKDDVRAERRDDIVIVMINISILFLQ